MRGRKLLWLAVFYVALLVILQVGHSDQFPVIRKKITAPPPVVIRKKIVVPVTREPESLDSEELRRIYKSIQEVLNVRITP